MSTPELLVIAGGTDPARGGQERSIREMLDALAALGVRTTLAAPAPHDTSAQNTIPIDPGHGGRTARMRQLLTVAEKLAHKHRDRMPVLSMLPVHGCHLYLPRGGLYSEAYARSAASRSPSPRFVGIRSRLSSLRRLLLRRERDLLLAHDAPTLVALSSYVQDQAHRHLGIQGEKVRIVRNGVALDRLDPDGPADRSAFGLPEDAVLLVACARNARLKGILRLADTVRSDLDREAPVILAIAGIEGRDEDRVRWLGAIDDIPHLLRCADALVHPTFYDPSSRVVLESLALGIPALTSIWDGSRDFLPAGHVAFSDPWDATERTTLVQSFTQSDGRGRNRVPLADARPRVSMRRHVEELLQLLPS